MEAGAQLSYEGVIERAATSAYSQGTHRIITENGAPLIQSSTINLSDYEGKEVAVSGTVEETRGNAETVLNVEEIHLTKISYQAPFADYESERYDFTLKYPETWEVGVTEAGVALMFEGKPWVNINVYNNEERLDTFVPQYEENQGVEVTVAHQRAIRFNDADSFRLYVEHPPTNRIYRIRFDQTHFSDPEKQPLFYELLNSFEFAYSPEVEGPACGGPEKIECEEDYRCELSSARSDAEGICVPISGAPSAGNCPYIAPPSDCNEYRVEEYNANGCPFRYKCLEEGLAVFESVELAEPLLPVNDEQNEALQEPEEVTEPKEELSSSDSQNGPEDKLELVEEPHDYTVPSPESVTGEYTSHSGLSIKYPKNWWFYNFGAEGIGFAPAELESIEEAVMVLKKGTGDLTREVDGATYGISGPDDMTAVMQAILDSVKIVETE
jgi:hypothetical protein